VDPTNGFIRTLYRPDSDDNVIFTTERCNSNCLVCSQPPRDDDDVDAPPPRNLELIRILNIPPNRLVTTGGEPTLLGDGFERQVPENKSTNADQRANICMDRVHFQISGAWHPHLMLGIPLYFR